MVRDMYMHELNTACFCKQLFSEFTPLHSWSSYFVHATGTSGYVETSLAPWAAKGNVSLRRDTSVKLQDIQKVCMTHACMEHVFT